MRIKLEVVHEIKGRARIKVESAFEPEVMLALIDAVLHRIEAVRKAEFNSYARSVTIHFKEQTGFGIILRELEDMLLRITGDEAFRDLIEELRDSLKYSPGSAKVVVTDKTLSVNSGADGGVPEITGTGLTPKGAVPGAALAVGITLLALAPGVPPPAWLILFAFSFTSFHQINGAGTANGKHAGPLTTTRIYDRP